MAALLLALAQSPDSSAEGMKALEAHNYELAAQYFTKAVEAGPKDYAAQFNLALAWTMAADVLAIGSVTGVMVAPRWSHAASIILGVGKSASSESAICCWSVADAFTKTPPMRIGRALM